MSLRTWCFNRGIARSLLRRFWLLWAAYFAVLLFLFPVMLMSRVHGIYDRDLYFNYTALNTVQPCVMVTVAAALLSVMAAFGWLYSPRQSNLMASLPISRPSLFLTSAAVSLGMCLGAILLTALLTLSVAVPTGQVQAWAVGQWLLTVSLACVGYFGFALFCAMLTGNLVVLPVLFVLLGCGVVVAESCMRHLMRRKAGRFLSPGGDLHRFSGRGGHRRAGRGCARQLCALRRRSDGGLCAVRTGAGRAGAAAVPAAGHGARRRYGGL